MIYLDHAATTPIPQAVADEMYRVLTQQFGNPSSQYPLGQDAKKMVEEGHFGGKGTECHKATIVGDTVGDPFKDTSGPSLNILIKLMSMVSIVMAGLTVACI